MLFILDSQRIVSEIQHQQSTGSASKPTFIRPTSVFAEGGSECGRERACFVRARCAECRAHRAQDCESNEVGTSSFRFASQLCRKVPEQWAECA